jgi:glycogen debranching enzyme
MPGATVAATSGTAFAISSDNGDMNPESTEGFFAFDTRFLSSFKLFLNGRMTNPVGVDRFDSSIVSFYCTIGEPRTEESPHLSIVRDRSIEMGLHEDIYIQNNSLDPRELDLTFSFESDFADIFEVRRGVLSKSRNVSVSSKKDGSLLFEYKRDTYERQVTVSVSKVPVEDGNQPRIKFTLAPRATWKTCVSAVPGSSGKQVKKPTCSSSILVSPFGRFERKSSRYLRQRAERKLLEALTLPEIQTDNSGLRVAYYQAIYDLSSLQLEILPKKYVLAAGLPWFLTLFGRDSAISAMQTKILGTEILTATVETLASLQATKVDQFREAEPGKIPHEVRQGELSVFEEVPHSRYYGSVDSTPLFVMLLWEAYNWTGDLKFLRRYIDSGEKAISWIDNYGDLDGDGFVEYRGTTKNGLRNQGWKDSEDSISFENGELAQPPIALSEVQGYVYSAKQMMADLYRVLGEDSKAEKLESEAGKLRQRFNEAFWMPQKKFFAIALDGRKNRVDSISSNPGHCLWTGIIDRAKAPMVAKRLLSDDMFSGWGVRTLSSQMGLYDPLSYHNGSVWPHDNSIICVGLSRYGYLKEAYEISTSLIDAASSFPDNRLPELFAGFARREHSKPIPYPAANSPQAWASGALIYCVESLLGLVVSREGLMQKARLEGVPLTMSGVDFRGVRHML